MPQLAGAVRPVNDCVGGGGCGTGADGAKVCRYGAVLDGKFYSAGGQNDNFAASNSVERYDFETKAWEAVAPLSEARYDHAVAVLDGKLYTVGGCKGFSDNLPQLGGAARPDSEHVGGGGAAEGCAVRLQRGGARRQAVRCGRQCL